MVLSVQSWVAEEGVGGCLERATVRVEGSGPSALYALRKAVMTSHRTVFNHVGLCVADRERSRRFYEGLLGFQFWWELELPDEGTEQLLQLAKPIGVRATYLVRDGLVLELIDYSKRDVHVGPERVMDQVGLTHLSLSVSDLGDVLAMVDEFRRICGEGDRHRAICDDPRPRRAADRAAS